MAYEVQRNRIQLPVSGLEAVVRASNARVANQLWEDRDNLVDGLAKYWAALTEELGEKKGDLVSEEAILDLQIPDQEYLGIEIYKVSKGPILKLYEDECPGCRKPTGFEIDLRELDDMPLPDGAKGPDPTWEVTLDEGGPVVVFGYRTGKQERAASKRKSGGWLQNMFETIRTIDGKRPRLSEVGDWPSEYTEKLMQIIKEKRCGYDPRVRFEHKCGHVRVINLMMDPSFLFLGLPG